MESSPLSLLPAELRVRVYELALYHETFRVGWRSEERPMHLCSPALSKRIFAITQTCRQIRRESESILYSVNTFTLFLRPPDNRDLDESTPGRSELEKRRTYNWVLALQKWLKQIGEQNASKIQKLDLELGYWILDDLKLPGWIEHSPSSALLTAMALGAVARFFRATRTVCDAEFDLAVRGTMREPMPGNQIMPHLMRVLVPVSGGDIPERMSYHVGTFFDDIDTIINSSIGKGILPVTHRKNIERNDRAHREFQAAVRIEEHCAPEIFGPDWSLVLAPPDTLVATGSGGG